MNTKPRLGSRYFWHIFTKSFGSVMYVSVDKQLVSVQNLFGVLLGFIRESVMRRFVISNFSASNITLCRVLSGPGLDLFISGFNYIMRGMIWEGEHE